MTRRDVRPADLVLLAAVAALVTPSAPLLATIAAHSAALEALWVAQKAWDLLHRTLPDRRISAVRRAAALAQVGGEFERARDAEELARRALERALLAERDLKPANMEDALARREALVREVADLERQVAATRGQEALAEERQRLLALRAARVEELQRLKRWMSDQRGERDWALLARARRVLRSGGGAAVDDLVEAIEARVPAEYLTDEGRS